MISKSNSLSNMISEQTGVNTARCYQCGKCSAGCPLAADMEYTSSMIMRMLQVEDKEVDTEVLKSQSIWLCVSCEMCVSRCPMQIDIPKVMDCLRQYSVAQQLQDKSSDKNIVAFHRSFLNTVQAFGRSHEISLIAGYKLRSRKFLQDLTLAPNMFMKGKLPVIPVTVKDRKNIKRIFRGSLNFNDKYL